MKVENYELVDGIESLESAIESIKSSLDFEKIKRDHWIDVRIECLMTDGLIELDSLNICDELDDVSLDELIEDETCLYNPSEIENFKQLFYVATKKAGRLRFENEHIRNYIVKNADQLVSEYGNRVLIEYIYFMGTDILKFKPEEFRNLRKLGCDIPVWYLDLDDYNTYSMNDIEKILDILKLEGDDLKDFYEFYAEDAK